jgi:hypothetical protein
VRTRDRWFVWPLALLLVVGGLTVGVVGAPAASGHRPGLTSDAQQVPLPASLRAVESSAEDIVDFALARSRANVVAGAASLKASVRGPAAAALVQDGLPSSKIALLQQRANRVAQLAQQGSFIDVALSANAVSELMPDLYRHFQDPVPAAVLTLDYLDREAQLRSLARQPEKVAAAITQLGPTWAQLRPKVIAAGGAKEAAAYQKHTAAMHRFRPDAGKRLQAEAVRGLELVDQIEQVFG